MADGKNGLFSKVKIAREALRARAEELLDEHFNTIREARIAGDFETAVKAQQWLLEHMPNEEGEKLLDTSIDKQVADHGPKQLGPTIQFGISIGGVSGNLLPTVEAIKVPLAEIEGSDGETEE